MTDDRPTACTEPPWQYILDRKDMEKRVPRLVAMQLSEPKDNGIARCISCGREFVQVENEQVCPVCRADYIEPLRRDKDKPKED